MTVWPGFAESFRPGVGRGISSGRSVGRSDAGGPCGGAAVRKRKHVGTGRSAGGAVCFVPTGGRPVRSGDDCVSGQETTAAERDRRGESVRNSFGRQWFPGAAGRMFAGGARSAVGRFGVRWMPGADDRATANRLRCMGACADGYVCGGAAAVPYIPEEAKIRWYCAADNPECGRNPDGAVRCGAVRVGRRCRAVARIVWRTACGAVPL